MKKIVLLLSLQLCLILTGALTQAQLGPANNWQESLFRAGEFPINTELVQITAPFGQSSPSIAFAGNVYLVVWSDSRSQVGKIYGARVDMNGNLLDPNGIIICDEPGFQSSPAVATNGNFFLVVWRDERNDYEDDIYGARVSFEGTILDPGGIPICTAEEDQDYPAVASVGTGFCVVWTDHRPGTHWDIYANLVSAEGAVSHPNGFPLCTLLNNQNDPVICSDGSRYFIVWEDLRNADDDIYGTFVETNGTVSHPEGTAIVALPDDQNYPAVWSGGGQFFLAWQDGMSTANRTIRGARISSTGALLDPNGIAITAHPDFHCVRPEVGYDGSNFWVSYAKGVYGTGYNFDILSCRVTPDGQVLDPGGIIVAATETREEYPVLAFDGQQMLICWQDQTSTNSGIYATFCDLQGNISPEEVILLSPGYNNQLYSKAGFDGTNYMAVWIDTRNDSSLDIYAARVNQSGSVIDQQALPVTTGRGYCSHPAICFNGNYYLVAWENGSDLFGARINTDGQVLDPGGFVIYQGNWSQAKPAIASDGQRWMVVWEDGRNSSHYDIYGTLISNDGTVLHPQGFPVIAYGTDQKNTCIAYDGANYVVAWEDYRAGFGGEAAIYGTRISPDGTVLDANGVALAVNDDQPQEKPALTHSGGTLMVCFTEENYSEETTVVKFVRFTPQMTILDTDPVMIDPASTSQDAAAVVSYIDRFFVIWTDNTDLRYNHVAMAIVNTDGTIAERGIFGQTGEQMSAPALTRGPSGQVFGLFSAFTATLGEDIINAVRLYGKQYGEGTGIKDHANAGDVILWPNPTRGKFQITNPKHQTNPKNQIQRCEVVDLFGNVMNSSVCDLNFGACLVLGAWDLEFDIARCPAGVYFVRIYFDDKMIIKKLIKL